MRRSTRRKLKVYAVDAAMIFLAAQVTFVIKSEKSVKASPVIYQTEHLSMDYQNADRYGTEPMNVISGIEVEQQIAIEMSDTEKKVLTKIAMAEAEGESTEGKALVMLVVLNRVESEEFPNTVSGVVFQKNQFSPVADGGRYWNLEPSQDCYKALELVQSGWDESQGALYFESCKGSSWHSENLEFLYQVGNQRFYR